MRLMPAAVRAAQRHLLAVHAVPRRRAQRGLADVPVPGSELTGRRCRRAGAGPIVAAADPGGASTTCSRRSGRPATPRTSSAARCATSSSAAEPDDWDLATRTPCPERVVALFPGAVYENRFGTVAVRRDGDDVRDHDVPERPRLRRLPAAAPGRVRRLDRARPRAARLHGERDGLGRGRRPATAGDSSIRIDGLGRRRGGRVLAPSATRARGSRRTRCGWSARSGSPRRSGSASSRRRWPRSRRGPTGRATCRASGSPAELDKLLARAGRRRSGFGSWPTRACSPRSRRSSPRNAACPQNKIPGEDLWDHTLRAVDAAPAARPVVRLAALLHDIGKPATFADGHFIGHDVGRGEASRRRSSTGCTCPARARPAVVELVRQHMFSYEPRLGRMPRCDGSSAASGSARSLEELLALREADNVGSGLPADAGRLSALRGADRRAARGRRSCSTGRARRRRRRPDAGARARPGPLLGRDPRQHSSSGSSRTRR